MGTLLPLFYNLGRNEQIWHSVPSFSIYIQISLFLSIYTLRVSYAILLSYE